MQADKGKAEDKFTTRVRKRKDGFSWTQVAVHMPSRNGNQCMRRWKQLRCFLCALLALALSVHGMFVSQHASYLAWLCLSDPAAVLICSHHASMAAVKTAAELLPGIS